jgi:DNA-binding NarL/FixJ family response regulator
MTIDSFSVNDAKKRTRIVLADDHPLMRHAIRMWLEKQQDLEVQAEASNGKEIIEIATKLQPDIVIMDISMPKVNGLEATRQIISKCPRTEVLALTVYTDTEHINGMLQAGARGYISKNASAEEIVHAVRAIAAGESILPNNLLDNVAEDYLDNTPVAVTNKINELTPRELFVLKQVAKGKRNKEIGMKLGLSERVIKANLTTIFIKLGVGSRTEAIGIGLKSGILAINDIE